MKARNPADSSIALFTTLVLALSGAYWLLFRFRDLLPFDPASAVIGAARGYTPALAAVVTALVVYGRPGLSAIGARLKKWSLPLWLYGLAILGPLGASLLIVLVVRSMGYATPLETTGANPIKLVLLFVVLAVVDGPLGEEIGWRGFLLPRLLERWKPLRAAIFVGVVWYLWHLPLYSATGRFEMTPAFLASYLANNVAFSLIYTWLFQRSKGSAFLAVVLHTASNYSIFLAGTLVPSLRDTPARAVHLAILVALGLLAALALWRRESPSIRRAA